MWFILVSKLLAVIKYLDWPTYESALKLPLESNSTLTFSPAKAKHTRAAHTIEPNKKFILTITILIKQGLVKIWPNDEFGL